MKWNTRTGYWLLVATITIRCCIMKWKIQAVIICTRSKTFLSLFSAQDSYATVSKQLELNNQFSNLRYSNQYPVTSIKKYYQINLFIIFSKYSCLPLRTSGSPFSTAYRLNSSRDSFPCSNALPSPESNEAYLSALIFL